MSWKQWLSWRKAWVGEGAGGGGELPSAPLISDFTQFTETGGTTEMFPEWIQPEDDYDVYVWGKWKRFSGQTKWMDVNYSGATHSARLIWPGLMYAKRYSIQLTYGSSAIYGKVFLFGHSLFTGAGSYGYYLSCDDTSGWLFRGRNADNTAWVTLASGSENWNTLRKELFVDVNTITGNFQASWPGQGSAKPGTPYVNITDTTNSMMSLPYPDPKLYRHQGAPLIYESHNSVDSGQSCFNAWIDVYE